MLTKYDFHGDSKATDAIINLTTDKTCGVMLLNSLNGRDTFLRMGDMGFLAGRALQEYNMLTGKGGEG